MIVVVGLSHRSAPIEVRERLAIPYQQAPEVLRELVSYPAVGEALLVSTCNRVEVIAAGPSVADVDLAAVADAALGCLEARAPGIARYAYRHTGADAVRHLFRVAASLDSLVLGEPQILGQLKCAFEVARSAGTLGARLNRAVPRAIRAAKRVRTETSIGAGQVSVPSVAVDLAREIFGELRGHSAVLIGSGEMALAVARLLAGDQAQLYVVARDLARARDLAARVGGEAASLEQLDVLLVQADMVITSTSAPGYVIQYDQIAALHRARRGRSLFFIDLAVPRDVDPRVETLERIFLYNVDDLARVVAEAFSSRQHEAELAEQLVARDAAGFERWLDAAEQVTPAIVALRSYIEGVLGEELERSLRSRLKHLGDQERAALVKMCEAAAKKLLHTPAVRLRQVASDQDDGGLRVEQLLLVLQELFDLQHEDVSLTPWEERASDSSPTGDADAASGRGTARDAHRAGDDPRQHRVSGVGPR